MNSVELAECAMKHGLDRTNVTYGAICTPYRKTQGLNTLSASSFYLLEKLLCYKPKQKNKEHIIISRIRSEATREHHSWGSDLGLIVVSLCFLPTFLSHMFACVGDCACQGTHLKVRENFGNQFSLSIM